MARVYPRYYSKYSWLYQVTNNRNHPQYEKFGGRGVTFAWGPRQYREFEDWIVRKLGHQPSSEHQLCRIDKRKGYEPGNLAWLVPKERSRGHTRQNVFVRYARKEQNLSKWSEDLDISYHILRRRINQGWTLKEIIKEYGSASSLR